MCVFHTNRGALRCLGVCKLYVMIVGRSPLWIQQGKNSKGPGSNINDDKKQQNCEFAAQIQCINCVLHPRINNVRKFVLLHHRKLVHNYGTVSTWNVRTYIYTALLYLRRMYVRTFVLLRRRNLAQKLRTVRTQLMYGMLVRSKSIHKLRRKYQHNPWLRIDILKILQPVKSLSVTAIML